MTSMKSFNFVAVLLVVIFIGCSSKSVGSQSFSNTGEAVNTSSARPASARAPQDKSPCKLKWGEISAINHLRLGMTPDEVLAVFPGSRDDAELKSALANPPGRFGNSEFLIQPSKYGSKEKFAGISRITFSLLDGRVSAFTINHNATEYPSVDDFVTQVVKDSNLPAAGEWELYPGTDNLKVLKCADFEIRVFAGGADGNLNYVLMQDLEAAKELKQRRAKARAAATPTPGE